MKEISYEGDKIVKTLGGTFIAYYFNEDDDIDCRSFETLGDAKYFLDTKHKRI